MVKVREGKIVDQTASFNNNAFRKSVADSVALEEVNAAEKQVEAQQQKFEQEIAAARKAEHDARIQQEQEAFVEELKPLTDFLTDLSSAGILPENFFRIKSLGNRLEINSGLLLGYRYKVIRGRYSHRDRYSYREKYQKRDINHILKGAIALSTDALESNSKSDYDDMFDEYVEVGQVATFDVNDVGEAKWNRGYSIDEVVFFGTSFTRGETSADDVNEFTQKLFAEIYKRHDETSPQRKALRTLIKKYFNIDADAMKEVAQVLTVIKSAKVLGKKDNQVLPPLAQPNANHVELLKRTPQEITDEVTKALNDNDLAEIIAIGADVMRAVQDISLDVIELLTPTIRPDELSLLDALKKDIQALQSDTSGTHKKQSAQKGFLKAVLSGKDAFVSASMAAGADRQKGIASNLRQVTHAMRQYCDASEQRVLTLKAQRDVLIQMNNLLHSYKSATVFTGLDMDISEDLENAFRERSDTLRSQERMVGDLMNDVMHAIEHEVKCFKALEKGLDSLTLISTSLVKVMTEVREQNASALNEEGQSLLQSAWDGDASLSGQSPKALSDTDQISPAMAALLKHFENFENDLCVARKESDAVQAQKPPQPELRF